MSREEDSVRVRLLASVLLLLLLSSSFAPFIRFAHAQELYSIPAGALNPQGFYGYNPPIVSQFNPQVVTASPGETVSFTVSYQTWTPPELGPSTVIWQLLAIVSWTPSWPPPPGYYIPFYDGIPGRHPGISETKSFSVTVPSTPGTYYIWFCLNLHYSMEQAIRSFNSPLSLPAHVKIIVGQQPPPNQRPTAYIDSISPNPAYKGQTVSFRGHGVDPDGSIVGYEWRSSRDGFLSSLSTFSTSTLSVGTHTIYFRVKDDAGAWSPEATATLVVQSFDFGILISPSSRTVVPGQSTTYYTTVYIVDGSAQAVSLSLSGLPSSVGTYSFSKGSDTPPFETKLIVNVNSDAPVGVYNLKVTGTSGDLVKESSPFALMVQAPSLQMMLSVYPTTLVKERSVQILLRVKDHLDNLIDAAVNCKVLTPSGREIKIEFLRLTRGIYQTTFSETTEVGNYRIIATVQKQGYVSDTKEQTFYVEGAFGIINIRRVYYDGLKMDIIEINGKAIKEGNHFNLELLLKNKRGGFYEIKIYRAPVYFTKETLVYQGIIWPEGILYPVRIQTPLLNKDNGQICIDVELSWSMEAAAIAVKFLLPVEITFTLETMRKLVVVISELTTYMVLHGYLNPDYPSQPDSPQKAIDFINGLVKLCSKEPDYVFNKVFEFATGCYIRFEAEGLKAAIKLFIRKSSVIISLLELNWHVLKTPATEIIYVDIGPASSSVTGLSTTTTSLKTKELLHVLESLDPKAIHVTFLSRSSISILQENQGANSSEKKIGDILINVSRSVISYMLNASFPLKRSVEYVFQDLETLSITSIGRELGGFIFANVTIHFMFYNDDVASYFFQAIDTLPWVKRSILERVGLTDTWNTELGINGTKVYLRTCGLRHAPAEFREENYDIIIKRDQINLKVFREMKVQNGKNESYVARIAFFPELFNVTSLYNDRMTVRLFIPQKMEVLMLDPEPTLSEGNPEGGFKYTWKQVPKELTLNYIIDETPPVILRIEQDPKTVTFENDVSITVNASDIGVGLKNITIVYSTDGGITWKKIGADQITGDLHNGLFKTTIPKQPYGTSVTYKLEVYDRAGNFMKSGVIVYRVELASWVYGLITAVILIIVMVSTYSFYSRRKKGGLCEASVSVGGTTS